MLSYTCNVCLMRERSEREKERHGMVHILMTDIFWLRSKGASETRRQKSLIPKTRCLAPVHPSSSLQT